MMALLSAPPPLSRLLPGRTLRGPTAYLIAIMTFAMMIVAAAGLALSNAAASVGQAVENRYVVQLPDATPRRLAAVVEAARAVPGVGAVEPVPEAAMRKTLRQWLGPAADDPTLPVPALIGVDVDSGGAVTRLDRSVAAAAPGARLTAQSAALRPLLRSMRMFQWLALGLVLLMAAATAAAVVLAARGALDTHRPTIEIVHGIGATDRQVALLFQRKIALDALAGALAGAVAAALILFVLAASLASLSGDFGSRAPLTLGDLAILAVMPLAAVLLAMLVARTAVLAALRQAP